MNRGSIIYNNCEYELKDYFDDIDNKHKDKIKFLLCLDKNIDDLSYIFYKCESLISVEYYQMNNQRNVMNDKSDDIIDFNLIYNNTYINNSNSSDFSNIYCDSKQNESSISQNNKYLLSGNEKFHFYFPLLFSKLTNIRYMFSECNSLISLPDISKWNTSNVKDMMCLFDKCNSLISLPDISKWNTSNVENMS